MNASDTDAAVSFVTMRGGSVVPVEALRLAWSLEDRGARFAVEHTNLVVDAPAGTLTADDQIAIRRWKAHLIAITTYRAPEPGSVQ